MGEQVFQYNNLFTLESGIVLNGFHLAYHQFGELNADSSNVVWVFHALTANSNPTEWWQGIIGPNKLFDPALYSIICVNMPGSCYGSISPLDINTDTEKKYYHDFPFFTIRDMVQSYQLLSNALGISKIKYGIGGSMGGQQLLQWAVDEPHRFEHIIPIATNAFHSQWGIAFNESQRWAIETDPTWMLQQDDAGLAGMKAARSIALLSYRNYKSYAAASVVHTNKNAATYQRYQGEKLATRFNAFSYYFLSKAMDTHHLGNKSYTVKEALSKIKSNCLVIGISSDILFPISEQRFLAEHIEGASWQIIDSNYGHDGFLLEFDAITTAIKDWQNDIKTINI